VPRRAAAFVAGSGIDVELVRSQRPSLDALAALRSELGIERGPVVTMVSRLVRTKGVIEFCGAARAVRRQRPDCTFLLVGPLGSEGWQAVPRSEVEGNPDVCWLGPRPDVPALLAISDIFVLPTFYREGIPRALLEAGAMGLPLIATDMPGCRDVVRDGWNGLLVPPRNVPALTRAVQSLLGSEPEALEQMGEKSRAHIDRHFTLALVTDAYADIQCPVSHSLSDDPIVYPGRPGASHLHDFFGNRSTNAMSTWTSMVADSSLCGDPRDTGGYWSPALYEDGVRVNPAGVSSLGRAVREQFYYRKIGTGPVRPFPADLRMVAGAHDATAPYKLSEIYWGCSDNSTGKLGLPPQCGATGIITLHVGFPFCWDGWKLDSADHRSHMAYAKSGACPSTHPVAVPRLIERFEYPVGPTTGNITLASGSPYTAHADFWNSWDQARLEQLTADCLNKNVDCGTLS